MWSEAYLQFGGQKVLNNCIVQGDAVPYRVEFNDTSSGNRDWDVRIMGLKLKSGAGIHMEVCRSGETPWGASNGFTLIDPVWQTPATSLDGSGVATDNSKRQSVSYGLNSSQGVDIHREHDGKMDIPYETWNTNSWAGPVDHGSCPAVSCGTDEALGSSPASTLPGEPHQPGYRPHHASRMFPQIAPVGIAIAGMRHRQGRGIVELCREALPRR